MIEGHSLPQGTKVTRVGLMATEHTPEIKGVDEDTFAHHSSCEQEAEQDLSHKNVVGVIG